MNKVKAGGPKERRLTYCNEVLRLHYEEGLGSRKISKLLPVERTTAQRWINLAASKAKEENIMKGEKKRKKYVSLPTESDYDSLRQEVVRLQEAYHKEKMRADAYDEMIDIAERQLNIEIRKKHGAKQ